MASFTGTGPATTMTVTETETQWAAIANLGAIFLGPFAPLIVWLAEGRRSPFVRQHVTQALNLTLTFLFYGISAVIATGLLALASPVIAFTLMALILVAGWILMVVQLIRGAREASRAAFSELPHWMCATIVSRVN
jgi:uncharacterized Tic20 family protein